MRLRDGPRWYGMVCNGRCSAWSVAAQTGRPVGHTWRVSDEGEWKQQLGGDEWQQEQEQEQEREQEQEQEQRQEQRQWQRQ